MSICAREHVDAEQPKLVLKRAQFLSPVVDCLKLPSSVAEKHCLKTRASTSKLPFGCFVPVVSAETESPPAVGAMAGVLGGLTGLAAVWGAVCNATI